LLKPSFTVSFKAAPVAPYWGPWSNYSDCVESACPAYRFRNRTCIGQTVELKCNGTSYETAHCYRPGCGGYLILSFTVFLKYSTMVVEQQKHLSSIANKY
jgi:hypothetical protein